MLAQKIIPYPEYLIIEQSYVHLCSIYLYFKHFVIAYLGDDLHCGFLLFAKLCAHSIDIGIPFPWVFYAYLKCLVRIKFGAVKLLSVSDACILYYVQISSIRYKNQ